MTVRRITAIVIAWALLVLALWVSHSRPAVFVLGGIVAALGATLFLALDLADAVDGLEWSPRARQQYPARRTDPRVAWVRHKVQSARWSGSTEISDTLIELLDDRLRAHHHIDRAEDPAAAAAELSPALRILVERERPTARSPRELQQLLTDIEAL
jgi:hypothetical protein